MSKSIVFYTKNELRELKPFIRGNQPVNEKSLKSFCKKYNRTYGAVQVKVYSLRNQLKYKKAGLTTDKSATLVPRKNNAISLNKSEFRVPINSWNITQDNGQFYFTVKF